MKGIRKRIKKVTTLMAWKSGSKVYRSFSVNNLDKLEHQNCALFISLR